MKKKRVGVFGGSFDPIHFGHLNLALSLKEKASLDEVLFVPANVSPFKQDTPPRVSFDERLDMVKLAIDPIEGFTISDIESKRSAPSYTIDTIKQLSQDRFSQLYLILAEDLFDSFSSWKQAEALQQLSPLLVGCHHHASRQKTQAATFFTIPHFEISSTTIRSRLEERLYCGHLLPAAVLQYIVSKFLYTEHGSKIGF